MRLSEFHKDLILLFIASLFTGLTIYLYFITGGFVFPHVFVNNGFVFPMCLWSFGFDYFVYLCLFDTIDDLVVFKYRIKKVGDSYFVQYLKIGNENSLCIFIPQWITKKKYEKVGTLQNMFGAKMDIISNSEVLYHTLEDAEKFIEQDKKRIKKDREEYFARPEKTTTIKYA